MWEQEGGEIMLVAPVCLCAYVSVCIAHVSGYAAHRKQTATNPLHTRGKTTTHTRPIADTKKAKHTHTNKTSLKQYPVHRCVLKCHVHRHTDLCTYDAHFPCTPNTHIPPPT